MTKKYFIPQFLLLCLFIASCGKANYEPQEYISTNLNEERILRSLINYEKQKQYNQFSLIYYNKIKLNNQISE